MAIEIWRPGAAVSPWRALSDMERTMDEVFGRWPSAWRRLPQAKEWMPSMEMYEKDSKFIIKAELPGVKEKDIDVSVSDHTLTIKGEKAAEKEVNEEDYYFSESTYGSFMRSITLPTDVDADKVEASLNDGVLEVSVPKIAEAKPKRVSISTKKAGAK